MLEIRSWIIDLHGQGTDVSLASKIVVNRGEGSTLEEGVRDLGRQVVCRSRDDVVQHSHPALSRGLLLRRTLTECLTIK